MTRREEDVAHPVANLAAQVYAYHADGSPVDGWPVVIMDEAGRQQTRAQMPNYSENWASSPSVVDIDADGKDEIILVGPQRPAGEARAVWLIRGTGAAEALPENLARSDPWVSLPVIDIDGNGELDLIAGRVMCTVNGKPVAGWPAERQLGSGFAPCAGDANGDGKPEFYHPSYIDRGDICGYDHTGKVLRGWPQSVGRQCLFPPVMGDIDGDGKMEIVAADQHGQILVWTWDGKPLPSTHPKDQFTSVFQEGVGASGASPTLADLDGDGAAEIVIYDAAKQSIRGWKADGTELGQDGGVIAKLAEARCAGVTVADLGGDGVMDLFAGTFWVKLARDGTSTVTNMLPQTGRMFTQCTISDLNKDGKADILFGLYDGRVFVYETGMEYRPQWMQWPTNNGNFHHTGAWERPKAPEPAAAAENATARPATAR
jgi:hypothetical protein